MDEERGAERALRRLRTEMDACRRCAEAGYSIAARAVYSGPASARVMVVGQAPGATGAESGRPFDGPSGARLFEWLGQAGWDEASFRLAEYVTAITRCYPGRSPNGKGDRAPTRAEQNLCAPFLERELALIEPHLIVPVGSIAVRRFVGSFRLTDVVGEMLETEEGRFIVPLPHPSGVNLWLNRQENQERVTRALQHLSSLRRQLAL